MQPVIVLRLPLVAWHAGTPASSQLVKAGATAPPPAAGLTAPQAQAQSWRDAPPLLPAPCDKKEGKGAQVCAKDSIQKAEDGRP